MSEKSRQRDRERRDAEAKERAERGEFYSDDELTGILSKSGPGAVDDKRVRNMTFMSGRYYSRIFFFKLPHDAAPNGGDVQGNLWRRNDEPNIWHLRWRFRYYGGPSAWQGYDKKSWYAATITGEDESQVVAGARKTFSLLAEFGGNKLEELVIEGDSEKAQNILMDETKRPKWMHMKVVNPKDIPEGKSMDEHLAELDRAEQN